MKQQKRVVTVTINPAIDQTITIPNFTAGTVNRVQSSRMDPGGKGINVASFLADFGLPAAVTGFLGAENDGIFRRLFELKGIEDHCVRIAGQTRTGVKISDEALRQTTDINFPGEAPEPGDIERLFAILAQLAAVNDLFVLSGSIPRGVSADIYAKMLGSLRGKKVVLDTSGEGFRKALAAGPWLIKPNLDELSEYAGKPIHRHEEIVRLARVLINYFAIQTVVVSMEEEGAIFVEGEEALWAVPPKVEVKSTVGAGDAMVAGIIAAEMAGSTLAETARLSTAFAVTAIRQIGSGLPSIDAVRAATAQVTLHNLSI